MDEPRELRFRAGAGAGEVSALFARPHDARWLLVLAHGAGAGMRHPFLAALAGRLAGRGVATLRYQFPYMEAGGRRPDPRPLLLETVRSAAAAAAALAPDLPLLAGGKSMGGRMTSGAAAGAPDAGGAPLSGVRGLVFFGFPLHPAGRPGTERGDHLARVSAPMLFLQGSRDALADLDLLRPVVAALGPRATLHEIAGADHSFRVLKRSGRTDTGVLDELADTTASWADRLG